MAAPARAGNRALLAGLAAAPAQQPIAVLVVEDDPSSANAICALLAQSDGIAPPTLAGSLGAALAALERGGIDAVVLDLGLPDSNGLATLDRVAARAPDAAIVVLTALSDEALSIEAVRRGAQDYLFKGHVGVDLLARCLRHACERKNAARERELLLAREHGALRQRDQALASLRSYARQQAALAELGRRALASQGLAALMDEALSLVVQALGVGHCELLDVRPGGRLHLCAGAGWNPGLVGSASVASDARGLAGFVLDAPEAVVIADFSAEQRFVPSPWHLDHGLVCGVAAPVRGRSQPLGVIGAYSRTARSFTDADGHFIQAIANLLGIASERDQAETLMAHQAHHDGLTGLPNRLLFRDRLAHAVAQAQRARARFALLFVDVDHLKDVNDTLGHAVGDQLLQAVAQRLLPCVRAGDTVARLAGDEFTLILRDAGSAPAAAAVAQKILAALRRPFEVAGARVDVTASIGVSLYPGDGEEPDALLRNADSALYRAKESGRNTYQLCTPELDHDAQERLGLERALRRAVERQEFVLHYQPRFAIRGGAMVGLKALLRWRHPERGLLLPQDFLPLAEASRLMLPIGRWVLEAACAQLRHWQERGHGQCRISVSLAAVQWAQPDLAQQVGQVLRDAQIDPGMLELEVTDRVAMRNERLAASVLRELHALGVQIALDDFGTGLCSLAAVHRFPIRALKIDRSLIETLASGSLALVQAIINAAHSLDVRVVAQGVETPQQLALLSEHGCDEASGYLLAAPCPADGLERWFD